jgi:DNA polymerase V
MNDRERSYIAIDLKSFYASVECMQRGLDPLTTNLVVADVSRTEKTICLAVSPALKAYGIPGRARLFEVVQKVGEVNAQRKCRVPRHQLTGESYDAGELKTHPELALGYIAAKPQMAKYMEISSKIYDVYLKYIAPTDIHVYSIDEVFIDATYYLRTYKITAHELALRMIRDVLETTGITATAGIGTNLYLCKVAMDIVAKHVSPDKDGVRIAELDEMTYRQLLWDHRPLTDFWRIGLGYAKKLEAHGLLTLGDIARCSLQNEDLLYKLFGINAELLIDHAWGWEPCTIDDIKSYKPSSSSIGTGQVLHCAYPYEKAKLIVREMADLLSMDLFAKHLVTDQLVLMVGYDIDNLKDPAIRAKYHGEISTDRYGRQVPKAAHGSINLNRQTCSTKLITDATMELFDRIVDKNLLVRRVNIAANRVVDENAAIHAPAVEQMNLFTDYAALERKRAEEDALLEKERKRQQAILEIKQKFGKNAILKGMNLEEGATTVDRNKQIGGHKA